MDDRLREIRRIHNEYMSGQEPQIANEVIKPADKISIPDRLSEIRKLHENYMGDVPSTPPVKKPDISWKGALKEQLRPSPAAETVAHLGWGLASWIPSKISGLGQIGFQKLNNALFGAEAENIRRTPEEREMFRKGQMSPEKIREMAEQSEAVWQILPPPESAEAKFVLDKIGVGLDKVLTPFRIADEYYSKKGYPNLGYAFRFAGELIFFKAVHGFGVKTTAKLKKLRRKIIKKAPAVEIKKPLGEVIDEMGLPKKEIAPKGDELKRPTKSQKIKAHKIQRAQGLSKAEYMEIAKDVTGETSIKDMNKASAKRFIEELKRGKRKPVEVKEEIKIEPEEEIVEPIVEKPPEIEIPDFKNTQEAYAFGERATPEQVKELQRLRKVQEAKFEEFMKVDDIQNAMDTAVKGQLYNEALQKVKGTEQYKKFEEAKVKVEPEPEPEPISITDRLQRKQLDELTERIEKSLEDPSLIRHPNVIRLKSLLDTNIKFLDELKTEKVPNLERIKVVKEQIDDTVLALNKELEDFQKGREIQLKRDIEPDPYLAAKSKRILEQEKIKITTSGKYKNEIDVEKLIKERFDLIRKMEVTDDFKVADNALKDLAMVEARFIELAKEGKDLIKPELPLETLKLSISDDIRAAQDMGLYAKIKEMIGEDKKVGEIMKEIKQGAYYKEDLADFGLTEKDIRDSIRAIKAEAGDESAIKQIQTMIEKEKKEVERISEVEEIEPKVSSDVRIIYDEIMNEFPEYIRKDISVESISKIVFPSEYSGEGGRTKIVGKLREPERYQIFLEKGEKDLKGTLKHELLHTYVLKHPELLKAEQGIFSHEKAVGLLEKELELDVSPRRVDPITGRPAGIKEELITAPKEIDDIRTRWMLEQMPIKNEEGKILKSKVGAMTRMKELGQEGELVKNPKGEGWLVKKERKISAEERRAEEKEWEDILKEEELGDIGAEGLGERVDIDIDHLWGEKGAVTFQRKTVKKLKDLIKTGAYSRNRIIKELRERGATDEDILKVFPDASVRILNEGKESKWWKPGQDSLALLPRRRLPNKMRAPAITRGEAHMIATMRDMPARLTAEHLSWENAIRTFEKLVPEMKETFYRTVKEGESLAFDRLHDVLKRSKKIRQSVGYFSHKRIGTHAIAMQPDGVAVLAQQGITKIPKLKPKELKVYEDMRAIYEEFFVAVNRARKAAGEKPFPPMKNYFTWIQDMTYLSKVEGIGLFSNWRTIESKMAEIKKVPGFRFAKLRAGPERPRKLNLNPFTVLDIYSKTATNYIEMAPRLAKLNELLTEKFGMAQNTPHAYNFIRHWLNYQAGKIPAWDIAHPTTRWAMRTLNSNIVYSLLAYNVRSALIQPAALASSYTMLGEYYMAVGLSHAMSPFKWKMAGKKSNILNTRSPEVAIYEAMEASGKFPSMFKKKVAKVGMMPLTVLDSASARITWLGAYAKGLKKFKSEQRAVNYADDIVTRTQASAARSDIAPIQRTQLGKTVTCLQTFVINHWGFLTKDVMGIKNADVKNPVMVKRVIRFILATTLVNAFYEDGLGLNSPNPTPIRAYREMFEETGDHKKAFARGIKEIAEYIPLWGGRLRYGSEIGGPALSELLKLIEDGDIDALIKLMGIPGSNQFFKMVRAHERGGTDIDIALGRYVEPRGKDIAAPMDKIKGLTAPIEP